MKDSDSFRFVNLLALELDNGDMVLPSLPDVVLKIRSTLANENADFEQISKAVSVDAVLVSRLFVFANSAYYNRANIKIDTLDTAISRLGVEVVRNTAMSLAMKQLYVSEKHSHANKYLKAVWARGMKLSCMAFAVALQRPEISEESAYLCGLLHEIGKLYIITKAEEFPEILGNRESFDAVVAEWNSQISKSIIEAWGFTDEMAESADPTTYLNHDESAAPELVDVVYVAKLLIDDFGDNALDFPGIASCVKLGVDMDTVPKILATYREKLTTMQQSLA